MCVCVLLQMNGPQIETKTRDGRRRITPILLAVQPDVGYDKGYYIAIHV